ncbi:TRADD-N-associated membrane domain-containing protein [Shewanella maritima]|uniref:TRADD-N-associated membrane domain-containing protein n=1 Tax=Shewanella maritima TaxID=2520507 RepID=UPI001F5E6C74|nr:hypothetical protein [Shewanella maritima]
MSDVNEKEKTDRYLAEIEEKIGVIQSKIDYKHTKAGDFIFIVVLISSFLFTFLGKDFLSLVGMNSSAFYEYSSLLGIAAIFYFGFTYAIILAKNSQRKQSLREELVSLEARKNIIRPINNDVAPTYFDRLVDINVSNLSDYYRMVKEHTDKSFLASISAGCIGFILIITGLIIGFTDFKNSESIAYLSAGSGVVVEFISGVFFYLYNKTTLQLKGYHDSLVNIQNVLLSFKIIEDTEDSKTKLEMTNSMIAALNNNNMEK